MAKSGNKVEKIQTGLDYTDVKTTEIYIKEAIAEVSGINLLLPWESEEVS